MKTPLTNVEHQQIAKDFRLSHQYARKVIRSLYGRYSKRHALSRAYQKLELAMTTLNGELDKAYHEVSSDAEFNELGHIYYRKSGTSMDDIWYYAFLYAIGRNSEIVYKNSRLMIDEGETIGSDTREQIITDIREAGGKGKLGSKEWKRCWTFVLLNADKTVLHTDGTRLLNESGDDYWDEQ